MGICIYTIDYMMRRLIIDDRTLRQGVRYLAGIERTFAEVIGKYGMPPIWLRPPGFATLVLIILEQQVSLRSARAAFDRLQARLGHISTAGFLRLSDGALKSIGFSRQKTAYCRDLAERIEDRRLDLDSLPRLTAAEVIEKLTAVRGIGPWTAQIYLIMALRRADIWPRGDLALRRAFAQLNKLPAVPDDDTLEREAEKWHPWRAVAARILWHYYLSQNKPAGGR